MIMAGDFRNGITFEMDGQVYQVVEFQHVKPGKGAAFVRTKLKNIITDATIEKTFSPSDKMPRAHIERKDMQYLYILIETKEPLPPLCLRTVYLYSNGCRRAFPMLPILQYPSSCSI
jgi:hypothetical protein